MGSRRVRFMGDHPVFLCFLYSLVVCSFLGSVNAQCYVQLSQADYPYCVEVPGYIAIYWVINNPDITFAVEVQGQPGWLAVGVSEGGMNGADIAAYVEDSGTGFFLAQDYFAAREGMPQLDSVQDVQGVSIAVLTTGGANITTLGILKRPLQTCTNDDVSIKQDTEQTLIWAFGSTWGYHGHYNRGSFRLKLWPNNSIASTSNVPPNTVPMMLSMPKYPVPTDTDSFACTNFLLPNDSKYQAVFFYGIAVSGLVHHMLLYECESEPANPVGSVYSCLAVPTSCTVPIALWNTGSGNVSTPTNAGYPFGYGAPQYYALQVHYHNPNARTNVIDSSGFSIAYTDKLRTFDMGVLSLGAFNFSIPAAQANYTLPSNWCPSGCTSKIVNQLNLVSTFLLMHSQGISISTQLIRNGSALEAIGSKMYYSFEFLSLDAVPSSSSTLMPGDSLVTTCSYNTSLSQTSTQAGYSMGYELCANYVAYYPRMSTIGQCMELDPNSSLALCADYSVLPFNLASSQIPQLTDNGSIVQSMHPSYTPYTSSWCINNPPPASVNNPNAKAAWAMIVLVPFVLCLIAAYIWSRYGIPDERKHLLAHEALVQGATVPQVSYPASATPMPSPAPVLRV